MGASSSTPPSAASLMDASYASIATPVSTCANSCGGGLFANSGYTTLAFGTLLRGNHAASGAASGMGTYGVPPADDIRND